jgi:hypothetical protein
MNQDAVSAHHQHSKCRTFRISSRIAAFKVSYVLLLVPINNICNFRGCFTKC